MKTFQMLTTSHSARLRWVAVFVSAALFGQTRIDFPQQVKTPSVVLIQRAICVQTSAPGPTGGDCTGLELYSLLFADGTQKILVGIPDDGTISKDAKWTPVPIAPPGTSTTVGLGQIRLK